MSASTPSPAFAGSAEKNSAFTGYLALRALAALFAALAFFPTARAAEDQVIYPRSTGNTASTTPLKADPATNNAGLLAFAALAAGAGGWFLWRQRKLGFARTKVASKLALAETRPLGNRQFLVVATYEDRKFLLGVCPGRIELLTRLDELPPSS